MTLAGLSPQVGEWTPAAKVNITDYEAFYDPGSLNVTLVVTTNLVSRPRGKCEITFMLVRHSLGLATNTGAKGTN